MNFLAKLFSPITALLGFIQRYFKSILFLTVLFLIFGSPNSERLKPSNLMKIELNGPIFDSSRFLEQVEEAEKSHIKGVLLVVNSPGGAVAPSIEMALAIKRLKKNKPVIAYASGIMASGSYYASIYSSKIIANPGAMIGSIGVIFQSPNFKELADKIGIKEQTIKVGKFKQIGTPTREWLPHEREELETMINDTYDMFVEDVANARGLDINKSSDYADAHVFTARMAKDVGLIDEVGSIYTATKEIEKLSGVSFPTWKKKDKIDKFMDKFIVESVSKISSYFYGLKAY
ncbi:MAG TPA: signal peptide peptidase SppA [Campylobacterales bacterium]|nr:signal peptide peptidase SppA [Campylobacterales bacterium]